MRQLACRDTLYLVVIDVNAMHQRLRLRFGAIPPVISSGELSQFARGEPVVRSNAAAATGCVVGCCSQKSPYLAVINLGILEFPRPEFRIYEP